MDRTMTYRTMSNSAISLLACLAATMSGCGHKAGPAEVSANAPEAGSSNSLTVILPPDSPKLRQIRVEPVQSIEAPTDEVIAAGSLEVNPSRVSRVMLPLAGRVTAVMANLGDAVAQGSDFGGNREPGCGDCRI